VKSVAVESSCIKALELVDLEFLLAIHSYIRDCLKKRLLFQVRLAVLSTTKKGSSSPFCEIKLSAKDPFLWPFFLSLINFSFCCCQQQKTLSDLQYKQVGCFEEMIMMLTSSY